MACSKVKVVKVTQEQDVSVTRVEQLSLEVQCIPGLVEGAKKLRERVSTLKFGALQQIFSFINSSAYGDGVLLRSLLNVVISPSVSVMFPSVAYVLSE